jgi:RNA recognition motif-containing protein
VMTDRATGKSKGYGFVTLEAPEAAARVLATPAHAIKDRTVEVVPPPPLPPPSSPQALRPSARRKTQW